jgi:hypothetical protein
MQPAPASTTAAGGAAVRLPIAEQTAVARLRYSPPTYCRLPAVRHPPVASIADATTGRPSRCTRSLSVLLELASPAAVVGPAASSAAEPDDGGRVDPLAIRGGADHTTGPAGAGSRTADRGGACRLDLAGSPRRLVRHGVRLHCGA